MLKFLQSFKNLAEPFNLRKQKDALDEERNQLSLDRIQYESDKNELANNLLTDKNR